MLSVVASALAFNAPHSLVSAPSTRTTSVSMGPSPISGKLVYSRIDPTKGPPCGVAHHQGSGTPTSKKVTCGVMDVDAPSMGKQLGCVLEGAAALPALPVTEDWQSAALAPSPRSTNGPLAGAFVRDMTTAMGKQLGCVLEGAALPALPVTEDWQSAALAPSPRSTNGPLAGAFVRDMTTSMGKQLGCVLEGGKLVPMEEFVGKVVPTKGLVPNEPLAGAFVNDMSSLGKQIGCVFDGA